MVIYLILPRNHLSPRRLVGFRDSEGGRSRKTNTNPYIDNNKIHSLAPACFLAPSHRLPLSSPPSPCLTLFPSLIFPCPSLPLLFHRFCPRLSDPLGRHTPKKPERSACPGQFHIDCLPQSHRTRQKTEINGYLQFFSAF